MQRHRRPGDYEHAFHATINKYLLIQMMRAAPLYFAAALRASA